jgi:hypothetical protein
MHQHPPRLHACLTSGCVIFISDLYPCKISDKQVVMVSMFLSWLRQAAAGTSGLDVVSSYLNLAAARGDAFVTGCVCVNVCSLQTKASSLVRCIHCFR